MDFFRDYLTRTDGRAVTKWDHYFDVYSRELDRFRSTPCRFLEIGIFRGGSIPMWKEYFAEGSHLVFVDIDPNCRKLGDPGTHIEIGDQADPEFLAQLAKKHGPFDVILDDGGHLMHQQIGSYEGLWPHLNDGGVYMVEDTHTSYWPGFGGGFEAKESFVEYAKRLVDKMHSWYTDQDDIFPFDPIARELESVRFYDSIVAMEKKLRPEPPLQVESTDGEILTSRKVLKIRNRRSRF